MVLLEFSMKSAWIQHEFNTIVMQNVAESVVKILGKHEISMKSAWIQHEFGMNSTPASPQPNLHQNLGKNLQYNTKSKNHSKCMNSAWIWHECDTNGNVKFHVWLTLESGMKTAWIWFDGFLERKVKKKSDKICVTGVLDWWFRILGSQNIEKIRSCWIHAGFMLYSWTSPKMDLKSFFGWKIQTANPNRRRKSRKIWAVSGKKIWAAGWC